MCTTSVLPVNWYTALSTVFISMECNRGHQLPRTSIESHSHRAYSIAVCRDAVAGGRDALPAAVCGLGVAAHARHHGPAERNGPRLGHPTARRVPWLHLHRRLDSHLHEHHPHHHPSPEEDLVIATPVLCCSQARIQSEIKEGQCHTICLISMSGKGAWAQVSKIYPIPLPFSPIGSTTGCTGVSFFCF